MSQELHQRITGHTELLALLAHPIRHSSSPRMHNLALTKLGLDYAYLCFEVDGDNRADAVRALRTLKVRGANVSMPNKITVLEYCDEVSPAARIVGACNTIVNDGGRLVAYNTDYLAIAQLLERHDAAAGSFAVLGAGGMAKAAVAALTDAGLGPGTVVSRREEPGRELADRYGCDRAAFGSDLDADLLLNATPIGMAGGEEADDLPVSAADLARASTVFDVVAFPAETPLVRAAREAGKPVITGAEIIALQAAEQFALYTGVRPTDEQVAEASRISRS